MRRYILGIMSLVLVLSVSYSVQANNDFGSNMAHYQRLCNRRSSFQANLNVCTQFEAYLRSQRDSARQARTDIQAEIAQINNDIQLLVQAIQANEILIAQKEQEIIQTEEEIRITEENISALETEILERIALAQEFHNDNLLIDFLINANSLDDFFTKMEGVQAINRANNDAVNDLNLLSQQLEVKIATLEQDRIQLRELQAQQNQMITDMRNREAQLFEQMREEQRRQAQFNNRLENINVNDIIASSNGLRIPVNVGWISSIAWFYPASFGGGWHPGLDIAAITGTPIASPANGVVLMTGSTGGGYGNHMVTAHQIGNDTYTFLYGHLSRFAQFGDTIQQGQTIGFVGSTGFSTGPHLHLEIFRHRNRSLQDVINTFSANRDIWFGLGYTNRGNCASLCRLAPHEVFNLRFGQRLS